VFDRNTHALLGETERLTARDDEAAGRPGQLIGASAYMESGIVASQAQRP
jgi:hypothetical protein